MKKNNLKAWLYLLPAILFLGVFMVYPLIDVCVYSVEENYNFASQSFTGVGLGNFKYVLSDPYFVQALKNTFLIVAITVPLSTGFALLISLGLSSIKTLRNAFQTIYFLPYVTNTLAVGLVFMILFKKTAYTDGMVNLLISKFGGTGASVNQDYYKAAKVDGASSGRIFRKITLPMISPTVFYLIITGFIGAFKAYSDEVALFGTNLNAAGMNTIVGYVYDMLYGDSGGYPSYAAAAALILFAIVFTITYINLTFSKNKVQYM